MGIPKDYSKKMAIFYLDWYPKPRFLTLREILAQVLVQGRFFDQLLIKRHDSEFVFTLRSKIHILFPMVQNMLRKNYIIRSQEKNSNLKRDSNLGPPDF